MRIDFTLRAGAGRLVLAAWLFCAVGLLPLAAQDARFAQFYNNPQELNPAMTGVFDGKYRFNVNYREQYASILSGAPFRTIAAGFDVRVPVMKGDYAAFGLSMLRDEVGLAGFNRTNINLGGSFLKQVGGSNRYSSNVQYLVAGAQLGMGQRGLNFNKLWFSNQFVSGQNIAYVDDNAASGEGMDGRTNSDIYLDLNAGLLWYALFGDGMSLYFGGAMQHINTPAISFLEDDKERLYAKWVLHGGGEVPLGGGGLSLLPGVVVMRQGPSLSTIAGGNFRYTNRDWREVAIRAGAWAHLVNQRDAGFGMDAITVSTILEMDRWNMGVSYDITTSVLSEANNYRGGFELSLIYTHAENRRKRAICPKF